ncbi:MAG: iron-sulfur cluster-binding protein [Bacteroidetes bacterium RIFCSPLOWO2_02_FULL_36_8]|nr:MAG: iron-sulfur cluster-binding protein [Bacteroidetes bacterium RIFCSPLOWO2_02_FULL_36_8]OFY71695.1 MAG: iron-sulfur cluster-binding protein [Bacteroidetes bacterium RIFCSPLOWO2_12_FULL_37_12]
MNPIASQFLIDATGKSADKEHQRKILFNIKKYDDTVKTGMLQFSDLEMARERASSIKTRVIENLDKYLTDFEKNISARGAKVIWAPDKYAALREIDKILLRKNARLVVKSKSMTTEEIDLNEHLENKGMEVIETDLGEFIVQLAGQKPYHIVTPAMHMSKEDVSDLFHKKLNIPKTNDPRQLTLAARNILRDKYLNAQVGITGANFLIADIGGISLTENEGNARLSTTFPRTHIVIAGIEKIIPSLQDLSLFLPLLATRGTGQNVTVYNTILSGPRQAEETDGPDEMYVILLDNGRTNLLEKEDKREALKCIRCGACLNACPVYKNIGGHAYNTTYSGPIGSVITPHFRSMDDFNHLSFSSSLCGACTEVCPVKIELHKLLLLNRKETITLGLSGNKENIGIWMWKYAMKDRSRLNKLKGNIKNSFLKILFKASWGKRRKLPVVAIKSFNQLWRERRGK